ncbi:MAG TPA: protein kinase [Pyrinomonadaceae bacterium]|nr:protein kinase [Pyrinomonadaceae bacterium]
MSPEKLKKVEELYHAVLEVSPQERGLFLQESCGDDLELRQEIESLLLYENDFDSLIDSAPRSLVEEIFAKKNEPNLIGKKINQYKIERKIGEGGMGAVYLAQDTKLERKVAIKLLSGEFAQDKTRRNRFFQEAKSASALNHPNILTVHEIGELDGTHFIVTEFIKGRTLSQYLAEEKPTLQSVLDVSIQIASALSAAHEAGIIHRDIKPDNVMVRNDGIVKVLDFGIAKLMDAVKSDEIDTEGETRAKPATLPGMIIGTPQYMSPEQARGQKIDLRSDIFSFGVLLYEMIAGKPPFSGATKMDIIGSILKDEPKPLSEHQPNIPHDLEHIVEKTLRKDRELRYQHIKDLFIDLSDIKKTLEFDTKLIVHQTDTAKAITTVNTTSGIVTQRRFSLVHLLIFILIAGGIVGGIWWFLPKSSTSVEQLKTTEVASWSSTSGEVYSVGSFSPDSKMVAFTSTKSGTKNVWVKQTTSGEAIQITKDEFRNEKPIWSPNGEELAYFSTKGNNPGFWRTPVLGGSPKLIATVEDASSFLRFWSKKDLIYYESKNDLSAIDTNSGQTKLITDFGAKKIEANSISISSDEQRVAYTTIEGEQTIVWTKKINEETPKKLFSSSDEIRNTAWHPDSQRIFFSVSVDGIFQVFVTDINGSEPKQITFAERDCIVLDVASDGSKILYGSAKEESDIWGFNVKDDKEFTVASDIDSELWANVAPDGKTIVYQSIKNLSQGNNLLNSRILTRNLNSDIKLTEVSKTGGLPVWSPNGEKVAFMRFFNDKNRIEVVKASGGQPQLIAEDTDFVTNSLLPYNRLQTSYFSWSPDSSKIAYLSKKSGQENIWLVSADGSNDVQLTDNKDDKLLLNCPLWSADGKLIAYTSVTDNNASEGKPTLGVWQIDVQTKISKQMTQGQRFLRLLGWGENNKELVIVSTSGSGTVGLQPEVELMKLETASGKMSRIAQLKDAYLFNIHLSPNKKSIAFAAHREDKDNLWLIPITGGEEKKLTENNDSRLYFSSMAWSPDSNFIFFGKQSRYSLLSMLSNFK